jgi:hypothetical protein
MSSSPEINEDGVYILGYDHLPELFEVLVGTLERVALSTAVIKHKTSLQCVHYDCRTSSHVGCVTLAHTRWSLSKDDPLKVYLSVYCHDCSLKHIRRRSWFISDDVIQAMESYRNYCRGTLGEVWHLTEGV